MSIEKIDIVNIRFQDLEHVIIDCKLSFSMEAIVIIQNTLKKNFQLFLLIGGGCGYHEYITKLLYLLVISVIDIHYKYHNYRYIIIDLLTAVNCVRLNKYHF